MRYKFKAIVDRTSTELEVSRVFNIECAGELILVYQDKERNFKFVHYKETDMVINEALTLIEHNNEGDVWNYKVYEADYIKEVRKFTTLDDRYMLFMEQEGKGVFVNNKWSLESTTSHLQWAIQYLNIQNNLTHITTINSIGELLKFISVYRLSKENIDVLIQSGIVSDI